MFFIGNILPRKNKRFLIAKNLCYPNTAADLSTSTVLFTVPTKERYVPEELESGRAVNILLLTCLSKSPSTH